MSHLSCGRFCPAAHLVCQQQGRHHRSDSHREVTASRCRSGTMVMSFLLANEVGNWSNLPHERWDKANTLSRKRNRRRSSRFRQRKKAHLRRVFHPDGSGRRSLREAGTFAVITLAGSIAKVVTSANAANSFGGMCRFPHPTLAIEGRLPHPSFAIEVAAMASDIMARIHSTRTPEAFLFHSGLSRGRSTLESRD